MKAIEADPNRNPVYDYTEASGTMTINDFIVLPNGYLYGGLSYPKTIYSEGQYLDNDTDPDPFRPGSNDDLVSTFMGDGQAPVILFLPGTPGVSGGEAGTYTKVTVYFNTMQFWISRTGNCMTPTPGPVIP
jgi:hypothetical protein